MAVVFVQHILPAWYLVFHEVLLRSMIMPYTAHKTEDGGAQSRSVED